MGGQARGSKDDEVDTGRRLGLMRRQVPAVVADRHDARSCEEGQHLAEIVVVPSELAAQIQNRRATVLVNDQSLYVSVLISAFHCR